MALLAIMQENAHPKVKEKEAKELTKAKEKAKTQKERKVKERAKQVTTKAKAKAKVRSMGVVGLAEEHISAVRREEMLRAMEP